MIVVFKGHIEKKKSKILIGAFNSKLWLGKEFNFAKDKP